MKTLFVFPGQGSQYPGIGKDIYTRYEIARETYDQASQILGYDVARLSFEDPDGVINLTRFTQPVLLTHSVACLRVFQNLTSDLVKPEVCAGHSLGEYSALVCAGSLSFEGALRLVSQRGQFMGDLGEGEMAAFPADLETVKPFADKYYCGIAGINLTDQTVIGGSTEDLDAAASNFEAAFPRKRTVRLKTEGAFHTYYMVPAARAFRAILNDEEFAEPQCQVSSNYTGGFHDDDPENMKSRLFLQLFYPVRWHDNLTHAHANGTKRIVEFGGGIGSGETAAEKRPNLEGIVKKTFRRADSPPAYYPAINEHTIEQTCAALIP